MSDINTHTIDRIPYIYRKIILLNESIHKDPEDPPILGDAEKQLGCVVTIFAISSFFLSLFSLFVLVTYFVR